MTPPVLETPRLRLRPLSVSDAPSIQALFPQWEVVRYLNAAVPWPYPPDGAETFLQTTLPKNEAGTQFDWAITRRDDPESLLIGSIALYPQNEQDHRGFWLGRDYHRRGLMAEAVRAVTDFAFDVLELPELRLTNAEPNTGSHRLKERCGAEVVEVVEDHSFVGGRFRLVRWRLTREAWDRHRTAAGSEGMKKG